MGKERERERIVWVCWLSSLGMLCKREGRRERESKEREREREREGERGKRGMYVFMYVFISEHIFSF
jgi:hypothetical protein